MEVELALIREQLTLNNQLLQQLLARLNTPPPSPFPVLPGTVIPITLPNEISRKGKRWTDKEDEELYNGYRENQSWETLAGNHQRTTGALKIRMGSLLKKELDTGVTMAQLAEVLHRGEASIMELLSSNRYTKA